MKQFNSLYSDFTKQEGNQHIGSEYAIKRLIKIIKFFKISNVLEVGLGIGSISSLILELTNSQVKNYHGTENNSFCLEALKTHSHKEKLKIFSDLNSVPGSKYDLIIIDGRDDSLTKIKEFITDNGIIAIEGDRENQVENIRRLFPNHKSVHSISLKKNSSYSPFPSSDWQGGIKFIFVNPSKNQKLWCSVEKIFTFLKYKVPGRYLGN